jgi:hypothetical protein
VSGGKAWTEKGPAATNYTDCTYCSLLVVLVRSGFKAFPLGAYTHAERKAFRNNDPRLNFEGGVAQAKKRYGKTINRLADGSPAGLRAAMSEVGKVYAVAGILRNFPKGHPLRRFAAPFDGFHAVTVEPVGNGSVAWTDPMMDMGHDPVPATVEDVLLFSKGNYPNDARWLTVEEDNDVKLKGSNPRPIHNRSTVLKLGGYLVEDCTAMPYTNLLAMPAGMNFTPSWQVTGNDILGTKEWYGGWVFTNPPQFGYISLGLVGDNPLTPIEEIGDEAAAEKKGAEGAAAAAVGYAASLP